MTEQVAAIVPAAGRSLRMEGIDKLFVSLAGRPLLAWCVETLEDCAAVAEIVIAVAPDRLAAVERLLRDRRWRKTRLVAGGARRQDSVASALQTLQEAEWILVHDGDRPFLTGALVLEGLRTAHKTGVAVASVHFKDTVKAVSQRNAVLQTLDRSALRAVQTPQVFRADILHHAYSHADDTVTDDATLAERLGYQVMLYEGSYENLKVTTPDDLIVATAIARRREARRCG